MPAASALNEFPRVLSHITHKSSLALRTVILKAQRPGCPRRQIYFAEGDGQLRHPFARRGRATPQTRRERAPDSGVVRGIRCHPKPQEAIAISTHNADQRPLCRRR